MQLEGRAAVAHGHDDRAIVAHRLPVGGEHRAVGRDQADTGEAERLACAADERGHGALSPQHAAGDRGEHLGLRRGSSGRPRAAGGLVDDDADDTAMTT